MWDYRGVADIQEGALSSYNESQKEKDIKSRSVIITWIRRKSRYSLCLPVSRHIWSTYIYNIHKAILCWMKSEREEARTGKWHFIIEIKRYNRAKNHTQWLSKRSGGCKETSNCLRRIISSQKVTQSNIRVTICTELACIYSFPNVCVCFFFFFFFFILCFLFSLWANLTLVAIVNLTDLSLLKALHTVFNCTCVIMQRTLSLSLFVHLGVVHC